MKNYNWKQYYSDFSKQWIIHFLYKVDLTFTLKVLLTMEATIRTSNADTNMHVLYITFDLTNECIVNF